MSPASREAAGRATLSRAVPTFHTTTFGCQMNEHDSERMQGMLESLGYTAAPASAYPSDSSMPFMRSESCSFIWQPNVVTW